MKYQDKIRASWETTESGRLALGIHDIEHADFKTKMEWMKNGIMQNNNLGIPNWEGMEIFEHWNEGGFQNMILKCHVCDLGKLGENMMNDMLTQCNPDVPIEMVLTYCNSAVV